MDYLFIEVDRAIRDGANILILSDRGVDEYHVAMPSLLGIVRTATASGAHEEENFRCNHS